MVKFYTGAAPRISREKLKKLQSAGIVLSRNAEGTMLFRCHFRGRYSTFHVTQKGEEWLKSIGYEVGDYIDRHIVRDVHDFGYIQNLDAWLTRPAVDACSSTPDKSNQQHVSNRGNQKQQEGAGSRKSPARQVPQPVSRTWSAPMLPDTHQSPAPALSRQSGERRTDLPVRKKLRSMAGREHGTPPAHPSGIPKKLARKAEKRRRKKK